MKKIKIFLSLSLMLYISTLVASAQGIVVQGTVTDVNGEPLAGATVYTKDARTGTATDAEGKWQLKNVGNDEIIVASSVGFHTAEAVCNGRSIINFTLEPDNQMLEETIVVAFGTATKESFTGSAVVVGADDIAKSQHSSVTRALEGRVAGVQMTTSTGTLGTSPSIIIRGIGSINAGNSPLYVVDGVPFDGDLNNLNTADIESMTVLKDAASNALYGARGANGVIMITTKKAQQGKFSVNLDAKVGWNSRATQDYDVFTEAPAYYEAHYKSLYNHYRTSGYSAYDAYITANDIIGGPSKNGGLGYLIYNVPEGQSFIGIDGKMNPNATKGVVDGDYLLTNDDWVKETYRSSLRQEYNVSVNGGTSQVKVFASAGYLNDNGIIDNSNMKRYTARLKADITPLKWMKVGANINYSHYIYNNGNSSEGSSSSIANIFGYASTMAPIYPVYVHKADGSILIDSRGDKVYDFGSGQYYASGVKRPNATNSNPLQGLHANVHNSNGNDVNLTGYAQFRFLKYFTIDINAGAGLDETRSTEMANPYYGQFSTTGGYISKAHGRSTYLNLQQILSWNQTFNGVHNASLMIGHEYYKRTTAKLSAQKSKLFSVDNLELNGCAIDGKSSASSTDWYNNEGFFARALYDYAGRVFVSGSFRRDASSRFAPNRRWGNFWSVGASWLINKEDWFNAEWVDLLKIKASVGSQGNDNIGAYRYTDTYSVGMVDGDISVAFGSKGNENITWETNTNTNVGVEFDFFKGRLSGGVEYFYRKTSDMLFWFSTPVSLGYSGYYDNIGNMRNSGVEFELNGVLVQTKDIKWDLYVNATHYTTKVLYIPEKNKTKVVEGYNGYATGNKFIGEGLPFNTFYMPTYAGVNKEDGLPMYYKDVLDAEGNVVDKTTTTDYSSATDYLQKDPTPKLYGGFGTSFQWKGFDFSVSFNYSIGGLAYDGGYASLVAPAVSSTGHNYHKDVLKAWSVENPNSDFPRFEFSDKNIASSSSRFLVDASYLSFQNAQMGYTFPAKWTEKIQIKKLRIYLTCDNIAFASFRKGFDPRYSFTGATNSYMNSPVRTLSGGLNITF